APRPWRRRRRRCALLLVFVSPPCLVPRYSICLFALTFGSQIGSRAARSKRAEPAQRVIPFGGPVGRKTDDLGASGDRVEGNGAAESLLDGVDAAVGAAVAVVAHQEQMVR